MEGFPWDDLRKIFTERSEMAKVPNGIEILPKISIAWVGRMNVTDRQQTEDKTIDGRTTTSAKLILLSYLSY